jgi:hypothetical protein
VSQENVEAVKRSYETFNKHGVEVLAAEFWHEDVVFHDPEEFPDAEIHHGIEAAKAALQGYVDLVAGPMKVHVVECIDAGDDVFVHWELHERGVRSGAPWRDRSTTYPLASKGSWCDFANTSTVRGPSKPPGCGSRRCRAPAVSMRMTPLNGGRTEMVLATAKIEDFDRFWRAFSTKGAEKRKQHGSKGSHVFRDPNDDRRVWVVFDWDDEGYRNFLSDPDMPAIFEEGGVQGRPQAAEFAREHDV